MRFSAMKFVLALVVLAIGVAVGYAGISIGHADDAPPVGLTGILLMIGAVVLSVRIALRKP